MSNPEQGPLQQGIVGQWQTIEFEIPDFLEPVRESVDAFFGTLIDILNTLVQVLEVLKVFAPGLLDPVAAAIEALRKIIEDLLNDLRQAGLYIHGDFYILQGPDFAELRGGFLQFERRMLNRFLDRSDPNRPNFSENTTAVAVFLYSGTDIRGVNRIIQLISSLLNLFSRRVPVPRLQNQAYNVRATYGYDGATVFSFNKSFFRGFLPASSESVENVANPYNAVNLTWDMAPNPGKLWPDIPTSPPAGFLVEISTLRQGLPLVVERPIEGTLESLVLNNPLSKRDVAQVIDEEGNPLYLTGGADTVKVVGNIDFNEVVSPLTGTLPDAARVYALKSLADPTPIPLNLLKEGDRYYLQKSFFVSSAQGIFFSGRRYGITLTYDDMPYNAEFEEVGGGFIRRINDTTRPEQFFVRVRAVTRAIKKVEDYQFLLDQTTLRDRNGPVAPIAAAPDVDFNDRGPSSEVAQILFPDASTEIWLRAVAEALALLVLSRSDLPVLRARQGTLDFPPKAGQTLPNGTLPSQWGQYAGFARLSTGMEDIASFMMPQLVGRRQITKYFEEANVDPSTFRKKLFINCINTTNRLFTQNAPPLSTRQIAVERAQALLNYRVNFNDDGFTVDNAPNSPGASLLELLASDDPTQGIGVNPSSLGIGAERTAVLTTFQTRNGSVLTRSPHFFQATQPNNDLVIGSVDMVPVLYQRDGGQLNEIAFIRNEVPDDVYQAAAFVLQLACGPQVSPQERGWIAFRLFPQGLPNIDRFFDQILALLRSIQSAVESIAETIRRYIEFLQSRIIELQAFLNRINALIQQLLRFFFSIAPASGLILVAPGTTGIVNGLVTAQDKPIEPTLSERDSIGGGVVLVAGGIPTIALNIFKAFFQGDT
jgi:hypothetical protein